MNNHTLQEWMSKCTRYRHCDVLSAFPFVRESDPRKDLKDRLHFLPSRSSRCRFFGDGICGKDDHLPIAKNPMVVVVTIGGKACVRVVQTRTATSAHEARPGCPRSLSL